jgi:pyruvate/2-oxoglutarate dehydrogenase complex dihydrolipoamide acyltransferase (E2) component
MATKLAMPKWGMGLTEGTIVEWLKAEGDAITKGEPIVVIETAKATQEVEAPASGVLLKLLLDEGQTADVQTLIAIIGEEGEDISSLL